MGKKYTVERIDTQKFDEAIDEMQKAVKIFKSARKNIIRVTDPLMADWEGEGAEAFAKVYKKLKTELEDEEINLTTIKEDLEGIKESYEGWDKDLKTLFQQ